MPRSSRPAPRPSPRRGLAAIGAWLLGGCLAAPGTPQPRPHPEPAARLDRALARAHAHPEDWRAQADAGAALTRQFLEGDVTRFDDAVGHLQRAHQLHPDTRHLPRTLGRLLNMPLSEGDLRFVHQQQALYEQLVRATTLAQAPDDERFIDHCFLGAATAAAAYDDHRPFAALAHMRRLERRMEQRLGQDDDVDLHAMLGNYAQQLAGMTPVGRRRRVRLAIEHLEPVVRRWEELSPEARGLAYGVPGVRAVFTHWLAELSLADGRTQRATQLYAQVQRLAQDPEATPAMRVLAQAAGHRLTQDPPPPSDLLPLWPAGYDSCVACHAHQAVPHLRPETPALARR